MSALFKSFFVLPVNDTVFILPLIFRLSIIIPALRVEPFHHSIRCVVYLPLKVDELSDLGILPHSIIVMASNKI